MKEKGTERNKTKTSQLVVEAVSDRANKIDRILFDFLRKGIHSSFGNFIKKKSPKRLVLSIIFSHFVFSMRINRKESISWDGSDRI